MHITVCTRLGAACKSEIIKRAPPSNKRRTLFTKTQRLIEASSEIFWNMGYAQPRKENVFSTNLQLKSPRDIFLLHISVFILYFAAIISCYRLQINYFIKSAALEQAPPSDQRRVANY
jgi:hypothetical protein